MARKANNPENLKPFKKGQSGNPKGRPPKLPAIDEVLAKVLNEKTSNGLTRAENILRKMAIKGETDVRAAEMILDRAYGKPKQKFDHTSKGDSMRPLEIIVQSKEQGEKFKELIDHVSKLS